MVFVALSHLSFYVVFAKLAGYETKSFHETWHDRWYVAYR